MAEVDFKTVRENFKFAKEKFKNFIDAADRDFEFYLGDQWDESVISDLEYRGIKPLTINVIWPQITLLSGIESQNRTDFRAFPESKEDSIDAEIATRLLKNVMKNSNGNMKLAEVFRDGIVCGASFMEGYVDYENSDDLLTGDLKWCKNNYYEIYPDPRAKEYDLSDAQFVCKITTELDEDQLISIYPEAEDKIRDIPDGKIGESWFSSKFDETGAHKQHTDYQKESNVDPELKRKTFDLLEYHYKCYKPVYYIFDYELGAKKKAADKKEAEAYYNAISTTRKGDPRIDIVKRMECEIYTFAITGGMDKPLYNGPASTSPTWKLFPSIPFYVHRTTTRLPYNKSHLNIQGQVRPIIDLQVEHNKRRTQETHLLNTSANSGFIVEENSLVNEEEVKKFGSSPGVMIKYKAGHPPPQKITPTPLSQGHAQLAEERKQDIKEVPGINTDLLAMQQGGSDSGRAIALRQKQGLVMVQKVFDNFAYTKKIVGKFILSQLPHVFTVEKAMRVLGDAFIAENFQSPVVDPITQQPVIDPVSMQPVMQPDIEMAAQAINKVLTDPDLIKYDIEVGEGAENETIKYANYLLLLEMAKTVPIPPDVLVDESNLPQASKQKILSAIQSAQQAQIAQAKQKPGGQ